MRAFSIQSVLVPYAFSERCKASAEYAVLIAERLEIPIVFFHSIPYSSFEYAAFEGGAYVGASWPTDADVHKRLAHEIEGLEMSDALRSRMSIKVTQGDPPQHIEAMARSLPDALVVMATHGFGRFRRLVLGSVVNKVLHDLDLPVLTGAHLEETAPGRPEPFESVVCAIDLEEHSGEVLHWASEFAKRWGARLTVVHAVDWLASSPLDEERFTPGLRDRLMEDSRSKGEELLAAVGVEASLLVDLGSPEEVVSHAVQRFDAGLLIIGRTADHDGLPALREKAYSLVRRSPCPVISV
ncbi:MAG: hypothetical protein GC160_21430 [Acidobacteria bacterium]|nr:hypothetical protein [Acidobacteriota bacterium]